MVLNNERKSLLLWLLTSSCLAVLLGPSSVSTQDTLYLVTDPVVQLSTADFASTVLGSKVTWAVEFYSTWCAHCQRFAPVWVKFAESIKGWDSVVRVAAIACSDPKNAPTCRHNNIWGYPTIKFYPKNASKYHKGNPHNDHTSPEELRNAVLNYVSASRDQPRMQLQPIRSVGEAESLRRPSTHAMFLIAVPNTREGRYTAQTAVLDVSSLYPQVVVVWSTPDVLKPHKVTDYPGVYRLTDNGIEKIESEGKMGTIITRESMRSSTTTITTTISSTSSPGPTPPYIPPDGLHIQDLDSAVYYSLWVEVAAQKEISRDALKALKAHVNALMNYLPGSPHVTRFLKKVHHWLKSVEAPLAGKDWMANITSLQTSNAYVPQNTIWTGCKGTQEKFRGYPCSLWMTYHALTINAYLDGASGQTNHTKETLQTMVDYIENFFGCRHCAGHFATMATGIKRDVATESDAILWLWGIHNKVNHRLTGDETEDPSHPKIQFPSPKICSGCRLSAGGKYNPAVQWNDMHVLSYLVAFYRKENIIRDSVPSKFEKPKEEKSCVTSGTKWGSCSKSCGTGVSTRVSNSNEQCEMRLEFRLCQIRPCNVQIKNQSSEVETCKNDRYTTVQSAHKTRLVYKNCRSKRQSWRYCGTCKDKCCNPVSEKTTTIAMDCTAGRKLYKIKVKVMKINYCSCKACKKH